MMIYFMLGAFCVGVTTKVSDHFLNDGRASILLLIEAIKMSSYKTVGDATDYSYT